MKLNIFDIEKFVDINKCPEVTNPVYIEKTGLPTEDGLFSTVLFGRHGSYDRKTIFGYIDLIEPFLHPIVFQIIRDLSRSYIQIIQGVKYVALNKKGEIIDDEVNGETGLSFFYNNWDKIKWKETESNIRSEKILFLNSLKKSEVFIKKQLVIPAYYRDINISEIDKGKITVDEINSLYIKLISNVEYLKNVSSSFSFVHHNNIFKIQDTILEIHNFLIGTLPSKNGLFHKNLLGKICDLSTRGVITPAKLDQNKWDEQTVPFGYTGVPLSHAINLFYPFVSNDLNKFINMYITTLQSSGEISPEEVDYILQNVNPEKIKRVINEYIKSVETRFRYLQIPHMTKPNHMYILHFKNIMGKELNLTEILYIITQRIIDNKHVYVKRYPIENYHSIYASKIKLLTTTRVKKIDIDGYVYENFPDMDYHKGDILNAFIDSVLLNNSMIPAIGGDFDGDTVGLAGVFSNEANKEADEIINSPRYFVDINGKNVRFIDSKEMISTFYSITK